jgi:hypothetical protein
MSWIDKRTITVTEKPSFSQLASWLFLVISALLLIYVYYRSEFVFRGNNTAKYSFYFIVLTLGILFWGIVLRIKESIRVNIVLMTITIMASLYIIEIGITFFDPKNIKTGIERDRENVNKQVKFARQLGIEFDKRLKIDVVRDFRNDGIDAVPVIHPSFLLESEGVTIGSTKLFPFGGVSKITTVGRNESGKFGVYMSDRYGFNNNDNFWENNTVNWFLVGDSMVHGSSVQTDETISGNIISITNESVINVGYGGNGPLIELGSLVEYTKEITPKNVIWIYSETNDLSGNLDTEQKNLILMSYLRDNFSQNLVQKQMDIDEALIMLINKKEEQISNIEAVSISRFGWLRLYRIRTLINSYLNKQPQVNSDTAVTTEIIIDNNVYITNLFKKILIKAKQKVELSNGNLYFVYLPGYSRYGSKVLSHDKYRKKFAVIKTVQDLDIPVIDIHKEVLKNHNDPLSLFPFRKNGHYNAEGYSEIAKAIVTGVNKYEQSNK